VFAALGADDRPRDRALAPPSPFVSEEPLPALPPAHPCCCADLAALSSTEASSNGREETREAKEEPQDESQREAKELSRGRSSLVPPLPVGLTEPIGYEDMVRRVSLHAEGSAGELPLAEECRAESAGLVPEAVVGVRRKLQLGALGPKTRPPKSAEDKDGQALRSTCGATAAVLGVTSISRASVTVPALLASGLSHPRRPKSKSQARGLGDTRRCQPNSARAATDRSPSNNARPRARPLPLEIGLARAARDDLYGPSQPSSSSSATVSSRRGRRPGKPAPAKTADEESISPSPTAANRRRREIAMKTLHKTAEIYGAPVGGPHRHAPPSAGARGPRDE
ncbi:unnamed protein product, partial [Polarella glacialis]